jgi:23S rRNA pseudouridine2605 synthase
MNSKAAGLISMAENGFVRLQVFLAKAGIASRRKCESYIEDGRVKVNGKIVTRMGTTVSLEDSIEFDNKRVTVQKRMVYIALHKPRGYICSNNDDEGRPIAIDLLTSYKDLRIYSVGRLDFMSSGLILFTNDGDFTKKVSHPSYNIEKEYRVEAFQSIPDKMLENYIHGIVIEDVRYILKHFQRISERIVHLILIEGKNREIRRVFDSFQIEIKRLHRLRIGDISVKDLQPGQYRELSDAEIQGLLNPNMEH